MYLVCYSPWRFLFCLFLFLATSAYLPAQKALSRKAQTQLSERIDESPVFQRGFTGFTLFDPDSRQYLHRFQSEKYFTPASNTKIVTFFAAETLLRDEMPALFYQTKNDTLYLWGTGYPLLLHPDLADFDTLQHWLRQQPAQHWVISDAHYQGERFGEGWSWDDYPYGYQLEKAALPLYGNAVQIEKKGHLAPIRLAPEHFQEQLIYQPGHTASRLEDRNIFTFGERALRVEELDRRLAFRYSLPLAAELLSDTFGRSVSYTRTPLPAMGQFQTLNVPLPDTLYQLLLQDSDNYLAEQLLLLASAKRYGNLETPQLIAYVNDTLLSNLPQPLDWVDGSGLSRYNQFTPESITMVLDQLYQRIPQERLFHLFPAGGASGTIRNWYTGPKGEAFIFAKTGTLRHVHCLSGYLRTASDKVYIFSFMHNNYPGKINELRDEMEQVLLWLYEELDQ